MGSPKRMTSSRNKRDAPKRRHVPCTAYRLRRRREGRTDHAAHPAQARCSSARTGRVSSTDGGKAAARRATAMWLTSAGHGEQDRPSAEKSSETGLGGSAEDEGLHRGRFMLLAGSGLGAGAQRRGNLRGSLSGPEVAAHRAVEADRPGRPGPGPHYCITVPPSVVAPTV